MAYFLSTARLGRHGFAALLIAGAAALAGCSQEPTSFDDVYVPTSADERFPITVAEQPVKRKRGRPRKVPVEGGDA